METQFVQIPNEVIYSKRISLAAKALYAYMVAKPGGWDFSGDRIASEVKEGRRAIYNLLGELSREGFIARKKSFTGKTIYSFTYLVDNQASCPNEPEGKLPNVSKGKLLKQQSAETVSIRNKEKKEIKKEESKPKKIYYAETVCMTEENYQRLLSGWSNPVKRYESEQELRQAIERLDIYKRSNGKKYKDDYAVLQGWAYDKTVQERKSTTSGTKNLIPQNWMEQKVVDDGNGWLLESMRYRGDE